MKLLLSEDPYEYESLSSYIYRISKINQCKVNWLFELGNIKTNSASYDFLNYINKRRIYLSRLASVLNKTEDQLLYHTIHRYSTGFWNDNSSISTLKRNWLYKQYVREKAVFCPKCIGENPYQRIYWLLNPINICLFHNCYLISRCSICDFPVSASSLTNGICNDCKFKLSESNTIICSDKRLIQFENLVYFAFDLIDHLDYEYDTLETKNKLYHRFSYSESVQTDGHAVCNINKSDGTKEISAILPLIYRN